MAPPDTDMGFIDFLAGDAAQASGAWLHYDLIARTSSISRRRT
jgi:hypothetical protein